MNTPNTFIQPSQPHVVPLLTARLRKFVRDNHRAGFNVFDTTTT